MTHYLFEHIRQPDRCFHQHMNSKTNVVKYYQWSTLLDEVHRTNAKLILGKNHALVKVYMLSYTCVLCLFSTYLELQKSLSFAFLTSLEMEMEI